MPEKKGYRIKDLVKVVPRPYDPERYPMDPRNVTRRTSLHGRATTMGTLRKFGLAEGNK